MEQLKNCIHKIFSQKTEIDWLIVHEISKLKIKIEGVEFSFVNGEERRNEPFNTNQGYLSLKNPSAIKEFTKIAIDFSKEFKSNFIALANLFILLTRVSYTGGDNGTLVKNLKIELSKDERTIIFNLLISSLNSEYYKYGYLNQEPSNTTEWLSVFRSTQYKFSNSDPLINCLQLVKRNRNLKIDYKLLEKMKPLLRAVLIGQYNFDLKISLSKLKQLYSNTEELIFLSACLIGETAPNKTPPDWLTETLVESFLKNHWDLIGKHFLIQIFGLSYRNKNDNKLYDRLGDLSNAVLLKQIQSEDDETSKWISNFEFPDDFITLFSWFSSKKINLIEIPDSNRQTITNQFIVELQRIAKSIPIYLASENSSDPFTSFQLHDGKYQTALANILLLLLSASDTNRKDIKNVCHEFKPLFYGGFKASNLATHFTELMILIGLSSINLKGLEKDSFNSLKQYLKIISDTILIPYIHLTERDDEIWNPDSNREVFQFNAGKYLVSTYIKKLKESEIIDYYKEFFRLINDIAITKW